MTHSSSPQLSASKSVLLVDDSSDSRDMYATALAYAGFRVIEAADGANGLARAGELLPDVIVTDLGLPRLDGFEMVTRLHADPRTREIPVIVLSGWADAATRQRAMAAGAVAFLPKPCQPDALVCAITRAVRGAST